MKPSRSRSGAETDSSGYSDASGDFADLGPVTDPFLCDLRNNLLPSALDNWSPAQLAACLRSRGKDALAQLVTEHHIAGSFLTRLYQSSDASLVKQAKLSPEQIEQLSLEGRKLRLLLCTGRSRLRNPSFSQSEESGTDDSLTPKTMSRIRVKKMVAAIESAPASPTVSRFETTQSPGVGSNGPSKVPGLSIPGGHTLTTLFNSDTEDIHRDQKPLPLVPQQLSPFRQELDIKERSIDELLLSSDTTEPTIFGAEAWEHGVIGATARKVKSLEHATSNLEDPLESNMTKLSELFAAESVSRLSTSFEAPAYPLPGDEVSMTNGKQDNPDAVRELKKRIAELEEKVKFMENQENGPLFSDPLTNYEISQYLVMAGVGVCAVLGRSILKRLFWSSS